ncbi:MAG: LysM peptidoglycan-binding domain-containing protein [Proteobacteria bacterium]|nr:LysM peptidoglycan-binding domain-containing protein [Pseudomonadota bacterium]
MRKIISLICFLLPVLAFAGQTQTAPQIRSDAPDQYIVVKGDTLWGISGKFFKDPWRWPFIWGMNKDSIKDPHWIYPGATIVLDRANGTLSMGGKANAGTGDIIKLSPQIRAEDSLQNAILSIPYKDIEPFLSQPLVVSEDLLKGAPTLVGLPEGHMFASNGDIVYAKGLNTSEGSNWQAYRPGKTFIDPDTHEILGYEAIYLGDVEVRKFGDVSTVVVTDAKQEINRGDRLVKSSPATARNYLPRAPEGQISARVISLYGDTTQGGVNTVVTLNKGKRDGLQTGHALTLSSKGRVVKNEGKDLALPDEHYGLLFVFRVFDKVSYALVMQTTLPVQLLDYAQTP